MTSEELETRRRRMTLLRSAISIGKIRNGKCFFLYLGELNMKCNRLSIGKTVRNMYDIIEALDYEIIRELSQENRRSEKGRSMGSILSLGVRVIPPRVH